MARFGFLGAVAFTLFASAQLGAAQGADLPAEFPPADYTGSQYVDSKGCAFVRAGFSGAVNWVPRVSRSREQLCNFQPSLAQVTAPVPVPTPEAPVIEVAQSPAPAPQARENVGAPMTTVASITTPPRVSSPAPARQPTAAVPARRPAVPAAPPVMAPPPAVPAPAVTLAQACDGRFGVQPGFINSQTGRPIDCGAAPSVAAAAPTPAPAGPREITLAQACSEMRATGRQLVNANTGVPVHCGTTVQSNQVAASAPAAAVASQVPASGQCATGTQTQPRYMVGGSGYELRCNPTPAAQVTRAPSAPASAPLFAPAPVPASNPVPTVQNTLVAPPAGYTRVWDDGRVNLQRGLPRAPVAQPVSTPASVASAHRYVQVGTFANPSNAQATGQRLAGLGLPVSMANTSRNGTSMKIVLAGPFSNSADLQRALQAARASGFSDAYTRN